MVNLDCAHLVAPNPFVDRPATSTGFEKQIFTVYIQNIRFRTIIQHISP